MTETSITHIVYDENSGLSYVWNGSHTVCIYSELDLPAVYDKPNRKEIDAYQFGFDYQDAVPFEAFLETVKSRIEENKEDDGDD